MSPKLTALFLGIGLLLAGSSAKASIINVTCQDDGDGAIVCEPSWSSGNTELYADSKQYWSPGHIFGDVTTDTETDPFVKVTNDVENDTDFAWTDYRINITLNKTFSISDLSGPAGWTDVIAQPTQVGGNYVGHVDYIMSSGSPVAIGDEGIFKYKITFTGSVQYLQEMIPLPEPTTMVLLGMGAAGLFFRRHRRQ